MSLVEGKIPKRKKSQKIRKKHLTNQNGCVILLKQSSLRAPSRTGKTKHCGIYRGIAQLVEQRSPKPRVVGSSPSSPATLFKCNCKISNHGSVVQLVRTPACHAGGHGFEPHSSRQNALCVKCSMHNLKARGRKMPL